MLDTAGPIRVAALLALLAAAVVVLTPSSAWAPGVAIAAAILLAGVAGELLRRRLVRRSAARDESTEALRQQADQQAAVSQLGLSALMDLGLPALFAQAATLVAEVLSVPVCRVLEASADGRLEMRARVGGRANEPEQLDGHAAYTLNAGAPVIFDDAISEARFDARPLANRQVRSGAAVVIEGWDTPYGILSAYSRERSRFDRRDAYFLQSVANVLVGAIERARTESELKAQAQRSLGLAEASHALAEAGPDLQGVLEQVVATASTLFQSSSVVRLADRQVGRGAAIATHALAPIASGALAQLAVVGGGLDDVLTVVAAGDGGTGGPDHGAGFERQESASELSDAARKSLEQLGATSLVSAPLRARSRVIGAIALLFSGSAARHRRADVEFLQEFADRAALALENAGLFHAAQNRAAQQAAVVALGARALGDVDIDELVNETPAVIGRVLGVDVTSLVERVRDAAGADEFVLRAGTGWERDMIGARWRGADAGLAHFTMSSGVPVVTDSLTDEQRYAAPRTLLALGLTASVSVVVGDATAPIAALTAHSRQPRCFSVDDVNFLQAVANVLAGAVERRRREDDARHLALHDPLTGLPNRTLALDRIGHALERAQRLDEQVAVLFLDLDRFKAVNDRLGHSVGDQLLVAVADRLRRALRPVDTVTRFTGDEFVVVCEDLGPAAHGQRMATEIAQRILELLAEPFALPHGEVVVSGCIGIALAPEALTDPESLLRDADAAMYQAKQRGRGRVEVFDRELRAEALARLHMGHDLGVALERQELSVVYQPLIDLTLNRMVGVETLLRWTHPELGPVDPMTFIAIAEETGLIVPLGQWVLAQACAQIVQWREVSTGEEPFTVYVNLSARQLAEPDLVDSIARLLAEVGADPRHLGLEITESVLMDDAEETLEIMTALKALGVRLAMDDFGTGYSSLNYLKRMPVDVLKVDRSFVDGLGSDPHDSAIVAAVVRMADELSLQVTAEGVETDRQLAELRLLGCDMAQGYLFARPGPPEQIDRLLIDQSAVGGAG